ncbi:unnamed protein product [Cladocopium goreaui]|uniref:Uncharacterized protein n=1 Tax=Cladocopium goreaui TaxID=2562237 RepID=A0A9P1G201_9DINO|nr:unnamed protein product [Cladocopium goreaui]
MDILSVRKELEKVYSLVTTHGSTAEVAAYANAIVGLDTLAGKGSQLTACGATARVRMYDFASLFKAFKFSLTLRNASKSPCLHGGGGVMDITTHAIHIHICHLDEIVSENLKALNKDAKSYIRTRAVAPQDQLAAFASQSIQADDRICIRPDKLSTDYIFIADAERLGDLLALEPGHGEVWKNASSAKELEDPCKKAMEEQNEACDKATDMKVDNSGLGDEDDVSSEVSVDSKGCHSSAREPSLTKKPWSSKLQKQQRGHGAVIDALLPHCGTQGMTKAKLVELRNDMLAQHRSCIARKRRDGNPFRGQCFAEAAEEEVQTTDEMVDAEASQAFQPKGSQDGVEGKEEHVKLEPRAEREELETRPAGKNERLEAQPEEQQVAKRPAAKMEKCGETAKKRKTGLDKDQTEKEKERPEAKPENQPGQDQGENDAKAEDFAELTAGQLLRHESYMNAVRGLKEGQITEQAFLAMFTHKQRQGLFKMMESHRSPSTAAKWKSLQGTGSNSKKQSMLLAFIKGGLKKSLVNFKHTVQQGWESTKTTAWVSWKQKTDEHGKDEAIQRLKAEEAWKKGLKLWQFLKVEEEIKMGRSGNQAMTGCSSGVATEEQGEKVARALKSVQASDEEFFNAAWLGTKPKNACMEDWQLTESEDLEAAPQHESEDDMEVFLAGGRVEDASPEACEKAKPSKAPGKTTQKPSEACEEAKLSKARTEACDKAKPSEACNTAKKVEEKLQEFDKNVDNLSSCDMGEARKMVSLLAGEIKTTRAMAQKHAEHKGLKQSLQKLEKLNGGS